MRERQQRKGHNPFASSEDNPLATPGSRPAPRFGGRTAAHGFSPALSVVDDETAERSPAMTGDASISNSEDGVHPSVYGASVISSTGDLISGLPMGPDTRGRDWDHRP